MIKAIFFDFEGVITSTPMLLHKNFFEEVQKIINLEEFEKRYQKAKIGEIKYKDFMKGLEEYEEYLFNCISLRENVIQTLEKLYKKFPLFVASNHIDYLSKKSVEKLNVGKYFKKMFFSNEMKLAKPSQEFFETILEQSNLNLEKNEMIFVEDAKRNLVTAKKLGFITVYLPNGISTDRRNQIDFEADYEIKSLKELPKIVEKINKN
jgi:2-haloacid dehalogenase